MNSIAKGFSSSFTNDAEIEYTRKQMLKALKRNLSRKTTLSQEEIDTKAEKLMRLHGLSQDNTDFLKMFQKQLNANINDVSIDDNANKNEKTIAGIQSEASAPQKKIAGYDFLYRVMKELYGKKRAKRLIGEMLDFSLPISDSTKLNLPYSYYGNTPVFVRINGEIICIPLKKLFNMFAIHSENRGTHEEINTKGLTRDLEITTAMLRNNVSANITNKNTAKGRSGKLACNVSEKVNIEVWDTNNGWVAVQRIIKHKTDTGFSLYQTEAGHFALVTDNHPIYMEDGTEKIASELSVGDAVLTETCLPSVEKTIIVPEKLAYLLGFMLGDGNFEGYCVDDGVMNGKDIKGSFRFTRGGTLCSVYQNDIDNSRIYSIIKDLFPDANLFKPSDKVERQINWSSYDMNFLVSAFFGFGNKENSFTKVLPKNILSWTNDSVEALVAGLVDADGYTYKKNGRVEICLQSMAVINTLYDVLRGIEGIRCLRKRIKGSDISNSIYALSFVPSSTNKMVDLSDKMKMHKEDYDKYNEKANTKGESNRVVKIIRFNLEDIPSTRKLREELQDVYDLTTATGRFYANGMVQHNCYALNATNLITEGRSFGVLPSKPAKRVNSYIAALCETIHQMSSHVAGALAIGTVFIDVAHLLMIKNKVPLDVLKNDKAVRKEIENEFQQLIHSVNHLSRDGVESPFTNVSVFDKHKLRYIIKEHLLWMFSDGGVVDIEECVDYVFELQEIFLDIFDKGDPSNNGMPYRFPVCTMNISKIKDGDDYILADEESLEIFLNRDISRYNIFTSESTKIASCCFKGDQEVLIRGSNFPAKRVPIEEVLALPKKECENKKIFANGRWLPFKKVVVPYGNKSWYRVTSANGKSVTMTSDHLVPTLRGDVEASKLVLDDYIRFNTSALYGGKEDKNDRFHGLLVGAFAGDGYLHNKEKYPCVILSLNAEKIVELKDMLDYFSFNISEPKDNCIFARTNNHEAVSVITEHILGGYAHTKKLNLEKMLSKSVTFRKEFINGYYITDGGNNNRIYTTSKEMIGDLEVVFTSIGVSTQVDCSDRTDEPVIIRGEEYTRNHPLYCIRWYENVKNSMEDVYVRRGNDIYFKVSEIVVEKSGAEDKAFCVEIKDSRMPYFTLPTGMDTHNCRLINDEEMLDVASTSNSFGAGVLSSIGSHRVVTLNFNKMALEAESIDDFWKIYTYRVEAAKDILIAHKVLIHVLEQIGLQPFITRGWIDLNRLFSTFGILGLYECEKVLKKRFGVEGDLKKKILTFLNRKARLYTKKNAGYVFNIEQIPAESMAVKVCSADRIIHGDTFIEYPLYANQFVPLWEEASLWDRLRIDGEYTKILTGGGIAHATVGQRLTREQAKKIICFALSCGCEHFAINTVYSECINSHVSMGSFSTCPICSEDISTQLTRVVGFFTPVKAWNKTRREFDFPYRKFVDKSI